MTEFQFNMILFAIFMAEDKKFLAGGFLLLAGLALVFK